MIIQSEQLLPMLKELANLSPVQLSILVYCIEHCPRPIAYSGDLLQIRTAIGCKPRTVQIALRRFNQSRLLSQLVNYRRIKKEDMEYELRDLIAQESYVRTPGEGV